MSSVDHLFLVVLYDGCNRGSSVVVVAHVVGGVVRHDEEVLRCVCGWMCCGV